MSLIYQRIQARRCIYWTIAILILIGVADYGSLKTPPKDIYLTSGVDGRGDTIRFLGMLGKKLWVEHQDGTRGWIEGDSSLTFGKSDVLQGYELFRSDFGYYYVSAEVIEQYCIGRTFEAIDGRHRMATEVIKKEDGRMEAKYEMIAALGTDGAFYQPELNFNEEGICDQVSFGKKIKDRNSFLLMRLPYVQAIMGWDWLTWHVQETLYTFDHDYKNSEHAWYTNILLVIGYVIGITLWAMAPPFLPVLLLLSCLLFSITRYIRKLIKILALALLITSSYVWMIAILSWGYPWLIGLPIGLCVMMMGFGIVSSIFGDDGTKKYWDKSDGEVLELIKPIVVDQLGVDDWEVVPQACLGDDLGCDEQDLFDLIHEIEERLLVALPYRTYILNQIKTVGDLVHIIKKYS